MLVFTFTLMHLADTFIQSDLHCIQVTVFYIWSALAFPGNRTHDLGVASAMLYHLSYRKAYFFSFVLCNTVFTTTNAYRLLSVLLSCSPWLFQHLSANYFQSWTEMYTGAHGRRARFWITVCVYDISRNIILWQRCLQHKKNVCFWDVCDILNAMLHFARDVRLFCILCAILGFVCKV